MSGKPDQFEGEGSSPFSPDPEDIEIAAKAVQAQIQQSLGLWVAGLEFCNSMVRQWTESRKKALQDAMRELAKADQEPDSNKRARMRAKVFSDQTNSALTDLLAVSLGAAEAGIAQSRRVMREAGSHLAPHVAAQMARMAHPMSPHTGPKDEDDPSSMSGAGRPQ